MWKYLIPLAAGAALVWLGVALKASKHTPDKGDVTQLFILLTAQLPAMYYHAAKHYFEMERTYTEFHYFKPYTWNDVYAIIFWGALISLAIYVIRALLKGAVSHVFIVAGVILLEFVLVFFLTFFLKFFWDQFALVYAIANLVIEVYTSLIGLIGSFVAPLSIFFPSTTSELIKTPKKSQSGSSGDGSERGAHSETDFSSMPGTIYSGNRTYRYVRTTGACVIYESVADSSDTIEISNIYSRGNGELDTDAGHFRY